jgi:hypothetical protein
VLSVGAIVVFAVLGVLAACPSRASREAALRATSSSAASSSASVAVTKPPRPRPTPETSAAAPGGSSAPRAPVSRAPVMTTGPAGEACRVTRGPIQLSSTGPVLLVAGAAGRDPHILFNIDGRPHPVTLPALPALPKAGSKPSEPPKPERLALAEPAERAGWPACAAAGGLMFCGDKAGRIRRFALLGDAGDADNVVAEGRPGSPIAAATIARDHVVYAFLADRKTGDGVVSVALAGLDDAPPIVLSEDGAGATHVALASRGDGVVAAYVDARRVLTPVHARVLTRTLPGEARLGLGPDAVLFVGSGTDGRTPLAIAQGAGGAEHALLPMDKDDRAFGLAAIRIDEQPHDDATTVWSLYPSAVERPVVAATQGTSPIRVLRTRPAEAKRNVVLELGELDATGAWTTACSIAEAAAFADPALLVDPNGGVWIAYTDPDGTWIERRGP